MLGNVMEWCHDLYAAYPEETSDKTVKIDVISSEKVTKADRYLRGGSWRADPGVLRCATGAGST